MDSDADLDSDSGSDSGSGLDSDSGSVLDSGLELDPSLNLGSKCSNPSGLYQTFLIENNYSIFFLEKKIFLEQELLI